VNPTQPSEAPAKLYRPTHPIRFVTAAALFDGHDAAINIFRRLLQRGGAEVIHLGHNRSAAEVVEAAIQEDVQGIAVSSYQGGHVEYFRYMRDLLDERGARHIRLFGGGGGVIVPTEIDDLQEYGIDRIYSPDDGRRMGLDGIIADMLERTDFLPPAAGEAEGDHPWLRVARTLTLAERRDRDAAAWEAGLAALRGDRTATSPVVGITGTGGAGKSCLTDEIVRRFLRDFPERTIGVLSVDPSKRRTGGALLGDRLRMNAVHHPRAFMRSLATRDSHSELSASIQDAIAVLQAAGVDLVVVETSGIGQGDAGIVDVCDVPVYVMTSEFGAPSQLEKIEMLDLARLVVVNKFDRRGSEDAFRDVCKQWKRERDLPREIDFEELPVFGTMASRFNDPGVKAFYRRLMATVAEATGADLQSHLDPPASQCTDVGSGIVPPRRVRYLSEISDSNRQHRSKVEEQAEVARELGHLDHTLGRLGEGDARREVERLREETARRQDPTGPARGETRVLRTFAHREVSGPVWPVWTNAGPATPLKGEWRVDFIEGGPVLPRAFSSEILGSWTAAPDPEAERFAGTARYTLDFVLPDADADGWFLDLGDVRESARVTLNGEPAGVLFSAPFRLEVGRHLQPGTNRLEIEVTNLAANRIRDLDIRGVEWKIFHDINFVDHLYEPFDASTWQPVPSGLLGPVLLTPVREMDLEGGGAGP